jgi:hypothetical protein
MRQFVFAIVLLFLIAVHTNAAAAKKTKAAKTKVEDPKECEVCIANLDNIDKLIPSNKKSNKEAIEKVK